MQPVDKRHNIVAKIKEKGSVLGLIDLKICDADPLLEAESLLSEWLDQNYHGTMEWIARTRKERANPTSFFPEAKSIIVVGLNYYRENEAIERPVTNGNISIYARGRDYHKVLRKKLKALLAYIQTLLPGVKGRICVDSFPLMEKAIAVKAGIGWIGKHTNLIIKQKGSYFFLGEILLSEQLPADNAMTTDYCGTCNRCQIACPTEALNTAYVLDASKCISYLTIEHKGDIAPELAENMENWVFGCDICQAVCPWNRFSAHTEERDFDSRLPDEMFDLKQLLKMDEATFLKQFEGTPVRRAGYQNFMRNVSIAQKNACK